MVKRVVMESMVSQDSLQTLLREEFGRHTMKVCQKAHLLCLAQSPDFHKLGLCYYLKILYL